MSSQDDPEARIRELERSLGERTSELTRSSAESAPGRYGAPPGPPYPPPLPPYGAPFPPPPPRTGGGVGRGWLVYGLLIAVLAAIIVGAVVFFSTLFSSLGSRIDIPTIAPPVPGGGGPFSETPGRSGANRPPASVAEPSTAPPGGIVSVSGVGADRTIECNDATVNISGVSNIVVLTGHCASVTVSGIENVITIDDADVITASGIQNQVTYRSGSPDIRNPGSSNVVERR